MESNIENLLSEVNLIRKHYNEIGTITGENFNIFKILKLTSNEVRTHSAFLTELLNPKGSHGQNDLYLKLFLETLEITNFDCCFAEAKSEVYIGPINEDKSKGGRIDVLITDKENRHIIIENKIYAREQENQLERYRNYGGESAEIIYLTLNGNASDESPEIIVKNISYKNDIIYWLDKCLKESVKLPLIRESIYQYSQLIKLLTGQLTSNKMGNSIAKRIIANKESVLSAFEIQFSIPKVKLLLIEKLKLQIIEIADKLNMEIYDDNFCNCSDETYLNLLLKNSKENKTKICFGFENPYNTFFIGIYIDNIDLNHDSEKYKKLKSEVSQKLLQHYKDSDLPNWIFLHYFEDNLQNIDTPENWSAIANNEIKDQLEKIIKNILELIKDIRL